MTQSQTVDVLKALADEVRLSIVRKIVQDNGEAKSCDIAACANVTQLSQPAMSHHFAKLVQAGVLLEHKQGTQKVYRINAELLDSVGVDIAKL